MATSTQTQTGSKPASLSNEEILRYSRHLIMPEVGMEGQLKLKSAKVLLIGTGGLGAPLGLYLAAAGVGKLGLVDFDVVDFTNLQRQVTFGTSDVGKPKSEAARARLSNLNPDIQIQSFETQLTSANALELFKDFDIIVSAIDNDIEVLEKFERVGAGELRFERLYLDVRVEIGKARAGSFALGLADVAGAKRDLALEIRGVDDVKVNQAEFADARGGKIQTKRRAEASRADKQYLGVLQLKLPLHADFRHDEVAAVTQDFFVRKARDRFCAGLRLYSCGHCDSLLL